MAAEEKWYFTKEQLANTPSRKCGFDADKELSSRQQAANFIQDMGQRLLVTQLCINTAIVYMHRFYMFHSFTRFHRNAMAAAALFLAAKVEEQPRKLEHVIKVAQICLHREQPPIDIKSEVYMEQAQELVVNENILLQTLGFDVAIDHPHTHVVRCCHLVRASKDLAQTSYFMASNSLHLTTMCLQYKPTVVACFCIHLACKWSNWEIPQSNEGKPWFWYVDKSVTQELLEQLTEEFLVIFEKCPSRLKKKIMSLSSSSQHSSILNAFNTPDQDKKRNGEGGGSAHQNSGPYQGSAPSSSSGSGNMTSSEDLKRKMEYSQRHHADYKKPHISHHSRNENVPNMSAKSSCMFGPPQRTQPPPSHSAGVVANTGSSNNMRSSHKPPPPQDQRPRRPEHHPQPYKKEQQHYFPQQPPTVEVPKPTSVPPVPKVERSIFSPEVSTTPEPKPEPILRIKEERVEEPPPPPPPPPPPVVAQVPLPVIKEEKIEIKQEPVEVKPPVETVVPPQVEEQHKEVKKKKKKHKEHKEKHKDKHKHKKEKHKEPGPIVITIPKDKLTTVPPIKEQSLKIKIAKDKITPITPMQQTSPVKLKIPKEKLKDSRKRERSESPGAATGTKRPNGAVQVGLDGGGRH